MTDPAVKFDTEKNAIELASSWAIEGLGLVLTYGAKKYAAHNWRKGMAWSRLIGAAFRHLLAFARGEDIDPESGLPHIDHAMCCLMFLSEYQKLQLGSDDRWQPASRARTPREAQSTGSTTVPTGRE